MKCLASKGVFKTPKRKPTDLLGVRLELQEKERDLIEQTMLVGGITEIIKAMASMDIGTMYGWLNIAEAFGLVQTPIPTVADASEMAKAVSNWATDTALANEQARKDQVAETGGAPFNPVADRFSLQDDLNYAIFRFFGGSREEWEAAHSSSS